MSFVEGKKNIHDLSPERLVTHFSQSRVLLCVAAALAVHVVVIGSMSVGYIRDRLDPEGAEVRKAAAAAEAERLAAESRRRASPTAASPTGASAVVAAPSTSSAPAMAGIPADRTNAPVIQRITERATPEELPRQPGEIGISIEDTNLK